MAFTKLTDDISNISKLSNLPNVDDGLTPELLKAEFDKAGNSIKDYVNTVLTEEIDSNLATKTELAEAVLSGISDNSITNVKLVDKTIQSGKIADDTITLLNLATALKPLQYFGKYTQLSGGSGASIISFSTEAIDELGVFSSANPSRITIPAGITRIRLNAFIDVVSNAAGQGCTVSIYKNGTLSTVLVRHYSSLQLSGSTDELDGWFQSNILTCTTNDYFELHYLVTKGSFTVANTILQVEALG